MGEVILQDDNPIILSGVDFLERTDQDGNEVAVGQIDHILVRRDTTQLSWCAVEMQAVYVSNSSWGKEASSIAAMTGDTLPFPVTAPRPDFRSSGPKRLMPQLQIKVPTLRRWGKKTCVVVDRAFFEAIDPMTEVGDLSNCDIVWFVLDYEYGEHQWHMVRHGVPHYTTLERAVEGLTAGHPVPLGVYEQRIRAKLSELAGS